MRQMLKLQPVAHSDRVFRFEDCCNVYLLRHGASGVLIDFGSGAVLEHLSEVGVSRVEAVYFTHAHRDQCQGADMARALNIPLLFPAAAKDFVNGSAYLNRPTPLLRCYPGKFDPPRPIRGARCEVQAGTWIPFHDWDLQPVAAPGHVDHQLAYLVDIGAERFCFCGDAMHSPGKVHEAYNLETDHYTGAGARCAAETLRVLKQQRPTALCPSHGPITQGDVWTEIDNTISWLLYLAELKDTICPRRPPVPRLARVHPNELIRVSEHLYVWNNSYFLLSDSGGVMMVDNAGTLPDSFWEQYDRDIGKPIEVVLVTHVHCDHVEGIAPLQQWQRERGQPPCEVWAHERIADCIENPHAFRRPYLAEKGTPVHRRLRENEVVQWHEYALRAYWTPGQTDLHATYKAVVDGHVALFSGDNFYPAQQWGGTGGLSGLNTPLGVKGWRHSIELFLRLSPEWILASHIQPHLYRREDYEAMLQWCDDVTTAMQALAPDGNVERHHNPHFISLHPYVQTTGREPVTLTARVMNPYEQPVEVQLRLVLPEGLRADAPEATLFIAAKDTGEQTWTLAVEEGVAAGMQMVTVDVVYDGKYLGEKAECYLKHTVNHGGTANSED
jgi:glyoxylase-like metal-dependent hydrolase (beta-lactamase superfamily II)